MSVLVPAIIISVPALMFLQWGSLEWYPLRYWCRIVGHRWYFYTAMGNLSGGEQHCDRCGRQEWRAYGLVFERKRDRSFEAIDEAALRSLSLGEAE